jgi:hypothetical protein
MDVVGSIAESVAKSYLIKTGIGIAANAIAPGIAYEMAIANIAAGGGVSGFVAGAEVAGTMLVDGIASGLAAIGPVGWAILAGVVLFSIYGGGGGSSPPPKEPKYHAAIYVTGNNDISAIAPVYQTTEYHEPPEAYKTIAHGLLRVAFNAAKSAEAVTKLTPPFDYLYIKIEFNRISLCWSKGAPNLQSLSTTDSNQAGSWGAPTPETNLNTIAKDIVNLITAEFKKVAGADAQKLDTAAKGLLSYDLDSLSSGLISDLQAGQFKLNTKIGKGIYANDVAESNRIGELIRTAAARAAYMTGPTEDSYVEGSDGEYRLVPGNPGGENMVWSMKQGKFVKNPFGLDAILLDQGDRPVYNLAGTSAGLSSDDFGGTDIVGIDRPANLYSPAATSTGGAGGSTVISAPTSTQIDNSSVANFYNPPASAIDGI